MQSSHTSRGSIPQLKGAKFLACAQKCQPGRLFQLSSSPFEGGRALNCAFFRKFFLGPVVVVMEPSLNVQQSDRDRRRVKIQCSRVMGRFKALICGVGHRRSYQKFESNGEETRDYWCYKCSQCGHRGKAKVSSLFFCKLRSNEWRPNQTFADVLTSSSLI